MKIFKLLIVFTLFIGSAHAQISIDTFLRKDAFFDISEPLKEWKNESAVVLAQKTVLRIDKSKYKGVYLQSWVTRTRMILQDKAAIEYWSNFQLGDYDFFEMKIYKKNGQIISVDSNDFIAVNESFSASSYAVNNSYEIFQYNKLAIENLEIGDIIDYTYQTKEIVNARVLKWFFPLRKQNTWNNILSYTYAFSDVYPRQNENYEIEIHPSLYISLNSLNGLSSATQSVTDYGLNKYIVAQSNVEAEKSTYFTNNRITQPKLKIDISYCQPFRYYRVPLLLNQPGVLNSTFNEERLKRSLFIDFHPKKQGSIVYLTTDEKNAFEVLEDLYSKYQKSIYNIEDSEFAIPSYEMAFNLYKLLSIYGFDADMVLGVPKENGEMDNLISTTEVEFAVRVNDGHNNFKYAFNFNKASTINNLNFDLAGTVGYAFKPSKKFKDFKFERVELPNYVPEDNKFKAKLTIELDVEKLEASYTAETVLQGLLRQTFANSLLTMKDYGYENDFSMFDQIKLNRYYNRLQAKDEERRKEYMRNWIREDYELSKYEHFELKSTGFENGDHSLRFNERYVVSDLIRTTGANDEYLVVDLGKTITGQVALLQEHEKRENDILVDFPKQYEYKIYLNIPSGYRPLNLQDFKKEIDTEAGTFKTNFELIEVGEGKVIRLYSSKSYNTTFLPKTQWNEMKAFLDAAYEFSQLQLILEKE